MSFNAHILLRHGQSNRRDVLVPHMHCIVTVMQFVIILIKLYVCMYVCMYMCKIMFCGVSKMF